MENIALNLTAVEEEMTLVESIVGRLPLDTAERGSALAGVARLRSAIRRGRPHVPRAGPAAPAEWRGVPPQSTEF